MRALMNIRADSIDGYATNNISHVLGFVRAECVAIARSDVARRFDLAAD